MIYVGASILLLKHKMNMLKIVLKIMGWLQIILVIIQPYGDHITT